MTSRIIVLNGVLKYCPHITTSRRSQSALNRWCLHTTSYFCPNSTVSWTTLRWFGHTPSIPTQTLHLQFPCIKSWLAWRSVGCSTLSYQALWAPLSALHVWVQGAQLTWAAIGLHHEEIQKPQAHSRHLYTGDNCRVWEGNEHQVEKKFAKVHWVPAVLPWLSKIIES